MTNHARLMIGLLSFYSLAAAVLADAVGCVLMSADFINDHLQGTHHQQYSPLLLPCTFFITPLYYILHTPHSFVKYHQQHAKASAILDFNYSDHQARRTTTTSSVTS